MITKGDLKYQIIKKIDTCILQNPINNTLKSERTDATKYEPNPIHTKGDVWEEVLEDMEARRNMGIDKYGTPLQAFNGRDALVDLYQELLDSVVYIKQKILENEEIKLKADFHIFSAGFERGIEESKNRNYDKKILFRADKMVDQYWHEFEKDE